MSTDVDSKAAITKAATGPFVMPRPPDLSGIFAELFSVAATLFISMVTLHSPIASTNPNLRLAPIAAPPSPLASTARQCHTARLTFLRWRNPA
jgi:hypothetical protein